MNSESCSPVSETSSPVENLNRTLVIGLGAAGAEICRRVIEYSRERSGTEQPRRVQCMCIGLSANNSSPAGDQCRFVELKDPGIVTPEDYAALRIQEAWNWLIVPGKSGPSDQTAGSRSYSRMALFNSVEEIKAELIRLSRSSEQRDRLPSSIFVAADAGETEGSSMFLDAAALAYNAFGGSEAVRFYGILLMPGYGSTEMQRAEAYAMLKETDYFMQGGRMNIIYPDGSAAVMSGKIFSSGNLFILDRQKHHAPCASHDKTNIDSAAGFIELMTLPAVSEFVSARQPVLPGAEGPLKRGVPCWSSFGICRSLNPAAAAIDAIAAHAAAAVLDEFFKPVNPGELLHELERIKGIPGSLCGPACSDILRKMHPGHVKLIESVTAEIRVALDKTSAEDDPGKAADVFREIADTYSAHGIERFRYGLVSAMEIRGSIEIEKVKILLLPEIYAMVNDPGRGFYFTLAVLDSMAERLSSFHDVFSSSAGRIEMHSADEMLCGFAGSVHETAEALAVTAFFNYRQFVYICMIEASISFLEKFILFLRDLRESISERIIGQAAKLRDESRSLAAGLVRGLGLGAAGGSMAGDHGSDIFPDMILSRTIDTSGIAKHIEPVNLLAVTGSEGDGAPASYDRFRDKLSEAVQSCMAGETSGEALLADAINVQNQVNRMLVLSEPAISFHSSITGLQGKTSALFTCIPFPGNILSGPESTGLNNGMFQVITSPDFNLSREAVMISLVQGFNLMDLNRPDEFSIFYHENTASVKPLHIFNSVGNNALHFPDPLGHEYMEPAVLWSALLLLKLAREENGIYRFDESLYPILRETGARVKYKKVVTETGRRLVENGTSGPAGFELIADAVNMLGMLAKGSGGGIVFRREYASSIKDILCARGAAGSIGSHNADLEEFSTTADIAAYLAEHPDVSGFILNTIKSIINVTGRGNSPGAFIMLPASRIALTPVPSFDSAGSFADYCMEYGSPGFYSAMKNILIVKLDEYIYARFVKDSGTPVSSAPGIAEFLRAVEPRIPSCVINGVKGKYGIWLELSG
ncbi:MAG TPA: tubulin-like doman-containing protein [Spirochaetota bacterium]|nr:tubulin-like doman-containing protein [Spirochaetota bacterium]